MGRRSTLHPDRAATKAERNALARQRLKEQGGRTVTIDLPGPAAAAFARIKAEHACSDREAIALALERFSPEPKIDATLQESNPSRVPAEK